MLTNLSSEILMDHVITPFVVLPSQQARLAAVSKRFAIMLAPLKDSRREATKNAFKLLRWPSGSVYITAAAEMDVYPGNGIRMYLKLQPDFIRVRIEENESGKYAPNRDADLRVVVVPSGVVIGGTWNFWLVREQVVMQDLQAFVDGAKLGYGDDEAPFVY